eukprot:gene6682-biopygen2452
MNSWHEQGVRGRHRAGIEVADRHIRKTDGKGHLKVRCSVAVWACGEVVWGFALPPTPPLPSNLTSTSRVGTTPLQDMEHLRTSYKALSKADPHAGLESPTLDTSMAPCDSVVMVASRTSLYSGDLGLNFICGDGILWYDDLREGQDWLPVNTGERMWIGREHGPAPAGESREDGIIECTLLSRKCPSYRLGV